MAYIVNWVKRNGEPNHRIFPTYGKAQSFYEWFTDEHPELDIKYPLPLGEDQSKELIELYPN